MSAMRSVALRSVALLSVLVAGVRASKFVPGAICNGSSANVPASDAIRGRHLRVIEVTWKPFAERDAIVTRLGRLAAQMESWLRSSTHGVAR